MTKQKKTKKEIEDAKIVGDTSVLEFSKAYGTANKAFEAALAQSKKATRVNLFKERELKNGGNFNEELAREAKHFLRRTLERGNRDHIFLMGEKGGRWVNFYDNSAMFLIVLSDVRVRVDREWMKRPISEQDKKTDQMIERESQKVLDVTPDRSGTDRSNYHVSLPNLGKFFTRLEDIELTDDTDEMVPEEFRGYILSYKLKFPFTQSEINNMYAAQSLMLKNLTSLVYGKNVDRVAMKYLRDTMEYLTVNTRSNYRTFEIRTVKDVFFRLFVANGAYARLPKSSPKGDVVAMLELLITRCGECQLALDYATVTKALNVRMALEMGRNVARLNDRYMQTLAKLNKHEAIRMGALDDLTATRLKADED